VSIKRVLIANRGEIAVRIARSCHDAGIETVLTTSLVDRDSMAADMVDRAICIGPPQAARSYLDANLVMQAALWAGCDAIHPGYGFLSERVVLARMCEERDITFIGPTAATIGALGDKLEARRLADAAGTPRLPGSAALPDVACAVAAAAEVGYPVLLKAAAGGGGRGMSVAADEPDLRAAFARVSNEARDAFGDGTLYLERFVPRARHVEIQVIGDGNGAVYSLGERDCSVQRRYQKVVEEAPAVAVSAAARRRMKDSALGLLGSLNYRGVGTVEFLYDIERDDAYFMEVNARIQVEHPVTEAITGEDIVTLQLAVAAGEPLPNRLASTVPRGHAIEWRINAEDPRNHGTPSPGRITAWIPPVGPGIRVDTACRTGTLVSPYYDSLLAKLIIAAPDRATAVRASAAALAAFQVEGLITNLELLRAICADPQFQANGVDTRWLERDCLPAFVRSAA
jgi:acetyl-CoA carboxylase biotin carboxylase subunit